MSKSAGGKVEHTAGSSNIDNTSQDYLKQIMAAAQGAGAAGPSPLLTGSSGYNTGMMGAGNLGMGAMSGDPAAVAKLMDPYQQQVIGGINQQWDQNDQHTMNAVNDRATAAGAFGGSRQGVATGTALAQNNMNRNQQIGGLLSSGFNGAMDRAGQLAQMGFAGSGANANLGMAGVGSPEQWRLQQLKNGFVMPMGQNTSQTGYGAQTQAGFSVPFLGGK